MVEGHAVQRLATAHRAILLRRAFRADSPNGRFTDGAAAINGRVLVRVEAPLAGGLVGLASASVATTGGPTLYTDALARLGPDPLRADATAARFLHRLATTDRSVGAVLMDQTAIAGVGNIFRSEVCYKSRVHPDQPGRELPTATAAAVWAHAVDLLQRGYLDGAIVTTDGAVAAVGRRRKTAAAAGAADDAEAVATLPGGGAAAGADWSPASAGLRRSTLLPAGLAINGELPAPALEGDSEWDLPPPGSAKRRLSGGGGGPESRSSRRRTA
ncbi:hypothetical protein I4F81_007874 [Pyropia yezoensis]|uniref:Uncharacterized protein n=1 Tax=Pyropia yezoensis TaxID=2788 RepID=A0ACC3C6J6_PYRYE|nr:hypothetical protein I4F81_007874 [Neopyropia yezoensis]